MTGRSPVVTTRRPARPGELCSCGAQAVEVYVTEAHGDVAYCGVPGRAVGR